MNMTTECCGESKLHSAYPCSCTNYTSSALTKQLLRRRIATTALPGFPHNGSIEIQCNNKQAEVSAHVTMTR